MMCIYNVYLTGKKVLSLFLKVLARYLLRMDLKRTDVIYMAKQEFCMMAIQG